MGVKMEDNEGLNNDDLEEINYRTIFSFFLFGIILLILTIVLFGLSFGYLPSKSGFISIIGKTLAFIIGAITLVLSIGLLVGAIGGLVIKNKS